MKRYSLPVVAMVLLSAMLGLRAEEPIEIDASLLLNASTGDFSPYYLTNDRYGTLYQKNGALLELGLRRLESRDDRFSWTYGVRLDGGLHNQTLYDRWDPVTETMGSHGMRPAAVWLQELWGGIKWRCLTLEAGMRQRGSSMVNDRLSSGDLMHSSNARPIPQVRIGFIAFQDIPLTKGWVQADVNFSVGRFFQNSYLEDQFNHYYGNITTNQLYCYRELWLRSNPDKPFMVTIGMEMATLYGGTTLKYRNGLLTGEVDNVEGWKGFWNILFPVENNGGNFYEGQHLGTWDLRADYLFGSGHEVSAYFQWLWEDGSGMRKGNGLDGLWGLEWKAPDSWPVTGAVLEYLDLTHQSGPIHWAPQFHDGSISSSCSGSDDYYNNVMFNAYINQGLSLGTPMMMSPIYNLNGYPQFRHTRVRALHMAVSGRAGEQVDWTLKLGHRQGLGTYYFPVNKKYASTMTALTADWRLPQVEGLTLSAGLGYDSGDLPSKSFGGLIGVKYNFSLLDR